MEFTVLALMLLRLSLWESAEFARGEGSQMGGQRQVEGYEQGVHGGGLGSHRDVCTGVESSA